jgi:ribosomal protein S18 acetylase RimI-like enzyme
VIREATPAVAADGGDRIGLTVVAANEVGVSFYESRGFEQVGAERVVLGGTACTASLYARSVETGGRPE